MSFPSRALAAGLAGALFLSGCAPDVVVKHWPDAGRRLRVAVLPFADAPGAPGSGEIAYAAFENQLLAVPAYDVVERGALNDVLKEEQLGSSGLVDEDHAVQVGKLLDADAVVLGQVTEYQERRALILPPASVALSVRMVDTKTGVVDWTASDRVGGLGRLFTWIVWPVGLIATAISPTAQAQAEHAARDICKALPKTAAKTLALR